MPHADIKYTSDIQIDLKTLMSDIEEIILDLDPTSGACKCRALKVDEYHHSHINIEIRLFATKNRDIDLLNELINRIDSKAKSFLKKRLMLLLNWSFLLLRTSQAFMILPIQTKLLRAIGKALHPWFCVAFRFLTCLRVNGFDGGSNGRSTVGGL